MATEPGRSIRVAREEKLALPQSAAEEAALVVRIRGGDEAAFRTLFLSYSPALCRFAQTLTHDKTLAEEVVQDTFLVIWAGRDRWVVTGALRAYLYTAVRNRALNATSRVRMERRWHDRVTVVAHTMAWRAPASDDMLEAMELADAMRTVLQTLPARCREAFALSREHGLSADEVAAVMGTSRKTVMIQLGRALRTLRTRLGIRLDRNAPPDPTA